MDQAFMNLKNLERALVENDAKAFSQALLEILGIIQNVSKTFTNEENKKLNEILAVILDAQEYEDRLLIYDMIKYKLFDWLR